MESEELSKRLAAIELAIAHLTEALEELAKVVDPAAKPSASLIGCHLRDVRENFNRVAERVPR
jgi:uncharacterized coiled-coil protein SlyX